MITIDDSILAFWYVELPGGNWMASLHREGEGLLLNYRFRYYKDDQAFDSADEKSHYSAKISAAQYNVMSLIEHVRGVITLMKVDTAQSWELIRETSTSEQFMDQFMKLPFVHQRVATADETAAWKARKRG